jgi:peptidoglycan hydrolase-like protein with peptidoglycan-binding domain
MKTLVGLVVFAAACHTRQVARQDETMKAPPPAREVQSARPVRTTPNAMIPPGQMRKVQVALAQHGQSVNETGHLDEKTESALRKFQNARGVPATGMPDFETVRLLGLDPQQIYLSGEKK